MLTLLKVIPAVNWFCAYMACAITFDYIMCMTLFMTIIVAHERRDQASGVPAVAYERSAAETSPLPGLEFDTIETTGSNNSGSTVAKLVGPEKDSTQTPKALAGTPKDSTQTPEASTETLKDSTETPKGRVKNKGAYMSAYGDFLMLTPVRVVVAAGFLAYGIMTVVLIDRIEQGLPRTSLAPDDSFLVGFFSIFDTTYQAQEGLILDLHVQGVDHSAPDIQARVMAAWGLHLQSPLTESLHKPAGGWMTAQNTRLDTRYSSPISWLTMATQAAIASGATAPCLTLGVSPEMCAMAAMPYRLADDSLTDDFAPPLIIQSAFNASLNAAIESAPPISSKLIRRSTDGKFILILVWVICMTSCFLYRGVGREYHQREGGARRWCVHATAGDL